MVLSKKTIASHFSKQYSNYDQVANFHVKCANEILNLMQNKNKGLCDRILEIGSHTGILSKVFFKNHINYDQYIKIDLQHHGEQKNSKHNNSFFIQADAEKIPFAKNTFSCIISNATFQWFNEWEKSLHSLMGIIEPSGSIIFTQFIKPSLEPLKTWYEAINRQQAFLELSDEVTLRNKCSKLGNTSFRTIEYKHYFSSLKELFLYLKMMGVNSPSNNLKRLTHEQLKKLHTFARDDQYKNGIPLNLNAAIICIDK
jgi:ubiquinone/menaquinone biosynthesis C-methylase UbiE